MNVIKQFSSIGTKKKSSSILSPKKNLVNIKYTNTWPNLNEI